MFYIDLTFCFHLLMGRCEGEGRPSTHGPGVDSPEPIDKEEALPEQVEEQEAPPTIVEEV